MSNSPSSIIHPRAELPQHVRAKVKVWFDLRGFGFLFNPDPLDKRDIYVHVGKVACRLGIGHRLLARDVVDVAFVQDKQGRLTATVIDFTEEFPEVTAIADHEKREMLCTLCGAKPLGDPRCDKGPNQVHNFRPAHA